MSLDIQKEGYLEATTAVHSKMKIKEEATGNWVLLMHKESFLPHLQATLPRREGKKKIKSMLREIIFKVFQSVYKKAKESLIKEGKMPGIILVGLDPRHLSSF